MTIIAVKTPIFMSDLLRHINGFFLFILFVLIISGCRQKESDVTGLSMLDGGKTFAVPSGTVADKMVLDRFPDARLSYFNTVMDCALAVKKGKADATSYDKPVLMNIAAKIDGLVVLDELIMEDKYGFAVQLTNTDLKKTMDKVLAEIKADGTYEAMSKRWFPSVGNPGPMPVIQWEGSNGVLRFGTSAVTEPMSYVGEDQQVIGFDIEYATYIARKLGKKLEIINMEFGAMIPALLSGKVDMIGAGLSITEERARNVLFSASYYPSGIAVMVKKGANAEKLVGETGKFKTLDDVCDKRIGVLLGSIHETYVMKSHSEAELLQFQNVSDLLTALKRNKIDAAYYDHVSLKEILADNPDVAVLHENEFSVPIAAAFNEDKDDLRLKFNKFLKEIKSNGVYDEMTERWLNSKVGEIPAVPDLPVGPVSGELRVGVVSDIGLPFTILKDGKLTGWDIELPMRFAAWLGKTFKPVDIQFGSMIASLSTNKIDLTTCSMMITEEREKQVDFSDPYMESGVSIVVRKDRLDRVPPARFSSMDDVADKTIGVLTGTIHDTYVREHYPKARLQLYAQLPDLFLALQAGKVDAAMTTLPTLKVVAMDNPDIGILEENVFSMPLGVGFNKNNPTLRHEFNAFLAGIRADGTYDDMIRRWFEEDSRKTVMPDIPCLTTGKTITAAVSVNDLPYVSFSNGKYVGFDVEMLQRFAARQGYQLKLEIIDFHGLIVALAAGKVDMISDGIAITEERMKSIDFSDLYCFLPTSVAVRTCDLTPGGGKSAVIKKSIWVSLSERFYNNIILEDRYKLIVDGLKVTLLISILAALFGTIIGGLVCFMRMSRKKVMSGFAKLFISLLRGTPVLVLLMIIFYVVFASVNINPVIVAVIAFGLNFGAYVSEMFRTSIESVDKGQFEAGIAGGFTKVGTFTNIIFPQALRHVLPVYKGEFISLVKMTSIVGYIAVQDVTRASDIIRSRTFDAFFPLIMAAVIYLLLAWLLTWALDRIEISVDPKRKRVKRVKEIAS